MVHVVRALRPTNKSSHSQPCEIQILVSNPNTRTGTFERVHMEESEDDFKGFGKDFAGFPKRLPEDCVEYSIFVIDSKLKTQKEILAQVNIYGNVKPLN